MKAITTIKALSSRSNHGLLPRPPAENRIKLYGLYKQATEGNVEGIMLRPSGLTLEDEGAKKKWDAWKREEGLSKTEAKRNYVLYLIETMRVYARGTVESRELLSELEYLWDQIKDVSFADDYQTAQGPTGNFSRYQSAPLVFSNVDQSDRYSTGTPWPLQSNYTSLVTNQQHKNNLEQIYLHSRRNTQLSMSELLSQRQQVAKGTALEVHGSQNSEEFRAWQSQINLLISKLSKDIADRNNGAYSFQNSRRSSEDGDHRDFLKRRVVHLVKVVGWKALLFLKNLAISLLTILFFVWFLNKNVKVQRTIVKKQLGEKELKELLINMVINTSENKWFIRLLTLLNSFVGFV